jgi:quercetin dioxygenase-like cupin family protein
MSTAPLSLISANQQPVYAVAGGNHVTIELDRSVTAGGLDVIEVLAQPGGGPPPHSHAFGEWFLVREGELTLCEARNGIVRPTSTLTAGDSVWVAPWVVHGTLNLSTAPTRFQVIGQPGAMTGYFAEAGVRVENSTTPPATEPPGPAQLQQISARWGIKFWKGPVDPPTPGQEDSPDRLIETAMTQSESTATLVADCS